eukprot:8440339-Alexandrium_andersonii.AAC.1
MQRAPTANDSVPSGCPGSSFDDRGRILDYDVTHTTHRPHPRAQPQQPGPATPKEPTSTSGR